MCMCGMATVPLAISTNAVRTLVCVCACVRACVCMPYAHKLGVSLSMVCMLYGVCMGMVCMRMCVKVYVH